MKVALCFLISYNHCLNKEHIWQKWIESNKDIINVYFHYKHYSKIKSEWIKKNAISSSYIVETDYMHVVPAYISLMKYAINHDTSNKWFCFLTDSCIPIIHPLKFRDLFFENYSKSIMNWKKAWWNIQFCRRANLHIFNKEFHLANDPWFILNKEDVLSIIKYSNINNNIYKFICNGNIANESIFSIILYSYNKLKNVKSSITHATDWSRMTSATSPHIFKEGNDNDITFITNFLNENKYTMFLRKVDIDFPDEILLDFIYGKEYICKKKFITKYNFIIIFPLFVLSIIMIIKILFLYT